MSSTHGKPRFLFLGKQFNLKTTRANLGNTRMFYTRLRLINDLVTSNYIFVRGASVGEMHPYERELQKMKSKKFRMLVFKS